MKAEITAEKLKDLLSEKGMRQKELCPILDATPQTVSKIIKGDRGISDAEQKLLRLYFYGEIPFDSIRRPEDMEKSSILEFTSDEWRVMEVLAKRAGYETSGEWIVRQIREYLAFLDHRKEIADEITHPFPSQQTETKVYTLPHVTAIAAGTAHAGATTPAPACPVPT